MTDADQANTFTMLSDYSPRYYVGIWQCGWPLPWYTFTAKEVGESDEGPFFAVHHLNSAAPNRFGLMVNSVVVVLTATLASLAIYSASKTLDIRLNLRMLLAVTAICACQFYTTFVRVGMDAQFAQIPALYIGETIVSDAVRPLSTVIAWFAVVVVFHPKFVIESFGIQTQAAGQAPNNPIRKT